MEIKELTPKHKEVVAQQKDQKEIILDTFSYVIPVSDGKNYLYIVSQIYSKDPSLDYLPNLVASFIKREMESAENEKFESSLKKANGLIQNVIKDNSELRLDLGVALLSKEKIFLSKVGKAKMLLHRTDNGDPFDVFQNITQFSKSNFNNKRFSNIISGDLKKRDRLFFFIPGPGLNRKQKHISSALAKEDQEKFAESVLKLTSGIPCCGIHLEINEEIKKISQEKTTREVPTQKEPQIVATEVSRINKGNPVKNMANDLKNSIWGNTASPAGITLGKRKNRGPAYLVAAAVLILAGLVFITKFNNGEFKEEIAAAAEKIKIAESRFLLKQNYDARKIANEAIGQLENLKDKEESREVLAAALGLLNRIEKTDSSVKPAVFSDLPEFGGKFIGLSFTNGIIILYDSEKIYELRNGELNEIWDLAEASLLWTKGGKVAVYNDSVKILDLEQRKISEIRKKFGFEPLEMKNYQDNLYFLGQKNIYKISNALINPIEELEWLKPLTAGKIEGSLVSFSLDSNIYALTDAKKLITLFKGEIVRTADLEFDVRPDTELVRLGDDRFLIIDGADKIARVVGAEGNLQESYDLSETDSVKDVGFDSESSTLYLLSSDKIWSLVIPN